MPLFTINHIKRIVLLAVVIICSLSVYAQREKNYIYLFDCTGSMKQNNLWTPAQSALDNDITLRATIPATHFTVIPFGDNPYQVFSFSNNSYAGIKQGLTDAFAKYIKQAKYTNISDVLKSGFQHVDAKKDNEIYLFTDGLPNNTDSPQKVAQTIREWCANHRNSKLYYVALTNGVINPVIKQAIDECPDASIVQCENGVIPVIVAISNDVYTNLEELDKGAVATFSIPGNYNLSAQTADDNFVANIVGGKASGGKFTVKISSKDNLATNQLHQLLKGEEYEFPITISCVDKRFIIVNPVVNVHVSDEVPSKLTLAKSVNEIQTDGVKWHDKFLWSAAAPDQKVEWDLAPEFNNELNTSALTLKFNKADGEDDDFQAWFNSRPITNGQTLTVRPGESAVLQVQFNHEAMTGNRYFTLTPTKIDGLDFINDEPADQYQGTSLRTKYDVEWNPLKTFLFWLGILLLAALLLWLIVLKRIFFPTIKMGKVVITGPGTYYSSKKIKGARKVLLTSKRKSQNIFSRIFTGEIKYIKADQFAPELSIVAAGGKKKVRVRSEAKSKNPWDIYPTMIFGQYDKGTLTNKTNNDKSEIEFN